MSDNKGTDTCKHGIEWPHPCELCGDEDRQLAHLAGEVDWEFIEGCVTDSLTQAGQYKVERVRSLRAFIDAIHVPIQVNEPEIDYCGWVEINESDTAPVEGVEGPHPNDMYGHDWDPELDRTPPVTPAINADTQNKDGRVSGDTGLSQVEPASRLDPSGFDPSRVTLPQALEIIRRIGEICYWEGGGETMIEFVAVGHYELGEGRVYHNPDWKPLP